MKERKKKVGGGEENVGIDVEPKQREEQDAKLKLENSINSRREARG